MGWIEVAAAVFGLICVLLYIRQNVLSWPTGLVQVILFIYIFYQVKLYSDLILHIIYVILQIYGWYYWVYGGKDKTEPKVTLLRPVHILFWVIVSVVGTLLWGLLMDRMTDASLPYPDAFTTVISLIAQWLLAKKKLESWAFWVLVDIAAIGIYFYKELYVTSILYSCFLILAMAGFFAWRKSYLLDKTENGEGQ